MWKYLDCGWLSGHLAMKGWKAVRKATASSADAVDARSCVAPWTCSLALAQGQPLTARCCPPVHTRCAIVVHDWFIIGLWHGSRPVL